MADAIKTFVVLDSGVSQADVERILPRGEDIEIVGLVHGIDDAWVRLHETANDLLLVVCSGQSCCSRTARRTASPAACSPRVPTTS
jgi:hypothetical protein